MTPKSPRIYWYKIREQYPEAFVVFWNWIVSYKKISQYDIECLENQLLVLSGCDFTEFLYFNQGSLSQFFDEQKIMIETGIDFTRKGYGEPLFCFKVDDFLDLEAELSNNSELYRTRPDAEQDAFIKAFALLNIRLLKNKKDEK